MTPMNQDVHWIEVVDGQGFFPVKRLGPYASARLAERAHRGVMRLLNVGRYKVAVVSQQDLEAREPPDGPSAAARAHVRFSRAR